MLKEKSCGAIIYRNNNSVIEFVIIKQKNSNHYGFPKGHIEENETEINTAIREVKEETGLDITIFDDVRLRVKYSPKKGIMKEVIYFLATTSQSILTKQESEIKEIKWVKEQEVLSLLTFRNDKKIYKKAIKEIKIKKSLNNI